MKEIIRQAKGFRPVQLPNSVEIATHSYFIHGRKSCVEYDRPGLGNTKCELGDLIFIVSLVVDGRKIVEKLTFNSVKRNKLQSKMSWPVDNAQLFLLSKFPTFKKVCGVVPPGRHSLPNETGCLGSYGFMSAPDSYAFVSATRLDSYLSGKNSLSRKEMYQLLSNPADTPPYWPIALFYHDRTMEYIFFVPHMHCNHQWAWSIFDFAHKYLTLGVGEPTVMTGGGHNAHLRRFMEALARVRVIGESSEEFHEFVRDYLRFPPYDESGRISDTSDDLEESVTQGGLGIVFTTIQVRRD